MQSARPFVAVAVTAGILTLCTSPAYAQHHHHGHDGHHHHGHGHWHGGYGGYGLHFDIGPAHIELGNSYHAYDLYGIDYVYPVYPRYYYYDQPRIYSERSYYQPRIPERDPSRVRVQILVPDSEAEVWMSGQKMSGTGRTRLFMSPSLELGKEYTYRVSAAWPVDGRLVTQERTIDVRPGEGYTIDFTRHPEPAANTAPAPEPKPPGIAPRSQSAPPASGETKPAAKR